MFEVRLSLVATRTRHIELLITWVCMLRLMFTPLVQAGSERKYSSQHLQTASDPELCVLTACSFEKARWCTPTTHHQVAVAMTQVRGRAHCKGGSEVR